jgi:hypothetical protein
MAAQGVLVVLDPDRGGLGGAQGVAAQQVGQGTVVDGDGLGDLEEPDQLEPVQTLGAGLVGLDPGSRAYTAGSLGIRPSMWANRKNPRTACIEVLTLEAIKPAWPRCRM